MSRFCQLFHSLRLQFHALDQRRVGSVSKGDVAAAMFQLLQECALPQPQAEDEKWRKEQWEQPRHLRQFITLIAQHRIMAQTSTGAAADAGGAEAAPAPFSSPSDSAPSPFSPSHSFSPDVHEQDSLLAAQSLLQWNAPASRVLLQRSNTLRLLDHEEDAAAATAEQLDDLYARHKSMGHDSSVQRDKRARRVQASATTPVAQVAGADHSHSSPANAEEIRGVHISWPATIAGPYGVFGCLLSPVWLLLLVALPAIVPSMKSAPSTAAKRDAASSSHLSAFTAADADAAAAAVDSSADASSSSPSPTSPSMSWESMRRLRASMADQAWSARLYDALIVRPEAPLHSLSLRRDALIFHAYHCVLLLLCVALCVLHAHISVPAGYAVWTLTPLLLFVLNSAVCAAARLVQARMHTAAGESSEKNAHAHTEVKNSCRASRHFDHSHRRGVQTAVTTSSYGSVCSLCVCACVLLMCQ